MLTLLLLLPLSLAVHADPNADCAQLASMHQLTAADLGAFKPWCVKFAKACSKIEAEAAEACGGYSDGSREINTINAKLMADQSVAVEKGEKALAACPRMNELRGHQINTCSRKSEECFAKKESFSARSGKSVELKCTTFAPEHPKWSGGASDQRSLCPAIKVELDKVLKSRASEAETCRNIGTQVTGFGGTKDQPGTNRAGATPSSPTEPKSAAPERVQSASMSSPSPSPAKPAWAEKPKVDTSLELPFPDSKACGLWGCLPNDRGTYNPIIK